MNALLESIVANNAVAVKQRLRQNAGLATQQAQKPRLFDSGIFHWLYAGDTALHLAAAGYRVEIARLLLAAGADANAARNHRRSSPLHYAADGFITGPAWNAERQVETLQLLMDHGADIHLQDMNGATPLHRAVRTRCAAAVRCLLEAGSNPEMRNKPGSTPFHLAVQNTGRGGSGAAVAVEAQREIIRVFLKRGLDPNRLRDWKGKSVADCARSAWIRDMLADARR